MAPPVWLSARRRHIPRNCTPRRQPCHAWSARTANPRSSTHVCRPPTAHVVPRRWRCPGAAAVALDLFGPPLFGVDAGVSRHHRRIAAGGRPSLSGALAVNGDRRRWAIMTATLPLADLIQTFFRQHLVV